MVNRTAIFSWYASSGPIAAMFELTNKITAVSRTNREAQF